MYKPRGLDHVVLRVRDQQVSQRFYIDVLGCTLEHVNEPISLVHLRFGDALIDLFPAGDTTPATSGGMDHFCLSIDCDDLQTVADGLKARGVTLVGDVSQRRGARGIGPSIYLRDPDGYQIELKPRTP